MENNINCINIIGNILTIITAIIGWLIVHKLSKQRDKEKETREFAYKVIINLIKEIENDAIHYHTSSQRDREKEIAIKEKLTFLDFYLQLLYKKLKTIKYDSVQLQMIIYKSL